EHEQEDDQRREQEEVERDVDAERRNEEYDVAAAFARDQRRGTGEHCKHHTPEQRSHRGSLQRAGSAAAAGCVARVAARGSSRVGASPDSVLWASCFNCSSIAPPLALLTSK